MCSRILLLTAVSVVALTANVGEASSSRAMPLSVQLRYYQAAVRAKMIDITPKHVQFALSEVIYGIDPGEVFLVPCIPDADDARRSLERARRFGGKTGPREPTDAEVWEYVLERNQFAKGREVVVLLQEGRRTQVNPAYRWRGAWTNPQRRPAAQQQQEVFDIVAAGTHLIPPDDPMDLAIYVQFSDRIVRAKLVKVGGDSTDWEVTGKVHYTHPRKRRNVAPHQSVKAADGSSPESVTVGLKPWRIRADAIARRGLKLRGGQAPPEEMLRQQLSRLVVQELHEGREAILFLGNVGRNADGGAPPELIGIVHADPKKPQYLNQLETALARIIEEGRHLGKSY